MITIIPFLLFTFSYSGLIYNIFDKVIMTFIVQGLDLLENQDQDVLCEQKLSVQKQNK
jgi:hypothetical protein